MQALNDALGDRIPVQSPLSSPESEVTFRPRVWSAASLDFDKGEEEFTHNDMANERRLQLLESAVIGMSDKFDAVLSSISSRPADFNNLLGHVDTDIPRATGSHQSPHRTRSHDTYQHPALDDFIGQQLRREEFSIPRVDEGKAFSTDFFVVKLIPKPYMYIVRPGLNTLKKKLDARATVSYTEYVVAFLKMIRDPRANLTKLSDMLLEHLQQVVQDAATRDWSLVREWSQNTFDAIERGDYTWSDSHTIELARLRSAIMASKPQYMVDRIDKRDLPLQGF